MLQPKQKRMFDIFELLHLYSVLLIAGILRNFIDEVVNKYFKGDHLMIAMFFSAEGADES